ncbi:MAG: pilus assembly protein [Nitriliruptorales bacterium]|nr:pilus assembly protein [Nitriliruptorales bacterium]
MSARRRLGEARGAASVEFLGILPYLLLAALLAWQLLLVAASVTAAENAARTGSRAATLGQDGEAAAVEALPTWLQPRADASATGGAQVTVRVRTPILVPQVTAEQLTVSRTAHLPDEDAIGGP